MEMESLKAKLKALSKSHSFELLGQLLDEPQYISQLSEVLEIPYTTAQQRVSELERAGLVTVSRDIEKHSKRAIKLVEYADFLVEISPYKIRKMLAAKESIP